MGTTADKLTKLADTKANIKSALEAKGQIVGDIPFAEYPTKINNIGPIGKRNLIYLELTADGWIETKVPISRGEIVTLKPGKDIEEANVGKRNYIPAMTFDSWICAYEIKDNTITVPEYIFGDIIIGASYQNVERKNIFVVDLTADNGNGTLQINFGSTTSTVYVDWGDGEPVQESTGSSVFNLSRYLGFGVHIIKIWNSSEDTFRFGSTSINYAFATSTSVYQSVLRAYFDRCSLANNAFAKQYALEIITIPTSLTIVGTRCFDLCVNLLAVIAPNVNISNAFFCSNCYRLKYACLNSTTNKISACAFQNCYNLTTLNIPENISDFMQSCIAGIFGLTQLYMPDTITTLGFRTFDTAQYKYLVLPSTFDNFGDVAAGAPESVRIIISLNPTPPTVFSTNVLPNGVALRFFVPDQSVNAYKNATNWSARANKIFPLSELPLYE